MQLSEESATYTIPSASATTPDGSKRPVEIWVLTNWAETDGASRTADTIPRTARATDFSIAKWANFLMAGSWI